jgi:hypothetical protein
MDQPDQSELVHQTRGGISLPRRVPPSLGDEGEQASLDPAVESVEQGSYMRLPIGVPPAADDGVEDLDHRGQAHRCAPARQVADFLPEPLHRLLTRDGVEVVRVGCGRALVRREPKALAPLDLVAEELEPVIDMNDPGLLRMEADPERLAQELVRQGEGSFGLLTRLADDDESSSGGESHPSALSEPDVRLSPHPAPTLQPPAARPVATERTGRDHGGRCAPASASPHVPGVGTACTSAAPIAREPC